MAEEVKFDKYVLDRRLAVGGMAEVFLGHVDGPQGFQKQVVVKRILPGCIDDELHVKMFLDEARLAARFNHPNLVHVYQLVEADGQYGLAMEYIEGVDLGGIYRRCIQAGREIPFDIAAHIAAEAAEGLHYAHLLTDERGQPLEVVHRDVSLGNIITTWLGMVKVVDFGVAKHADKDIKTRAGVIRGKYSYMSPEQVSADVVDARSDIFSLGIVFYELLTLVRCFKHKSEYDTLAAVRAGQRDPASKHRPDIPEGLENILNRMMSVSLDERFPSAQETARELRRYLATTSMPTADDVRIFLEDLYTDQEKTQLTNPIHLVGEDVIAVSDSMARPSQRVSRSQHDRVLAKAALAMADEVGFDVEDDEADAATVALHGETTGSEEGRTAVYGRRTTDVDGEAGAAVSVSESTPSRLPLMIAGGVILLGAIIALTVWLAARPSAQNGEATSPVTIVEEAPEGSVSITSDPPVDVYLGEKLLGRTPLQNYPLVAGKHTLALRDKALGIRRELAVEVAPGEQVNENVFIGKGTVLLKIQPWAKVEINGKRQGKVTMKAFELFDGNHRFKLSHPSLKGKPRIFDMEVKPGKTEKVFVNLQE